MYGKAQSFLIQFTGFHVLKQNDFLFFRVDPPSQAGAGLHVIEVVPLNVGHRKER